MPHTTGGSYRSRPGHANPRKSRMKGIGLRSNGTRRPVRSAPRASARARTRANAKARFKRY